MQVVLNNNNRYHLDANGFDHQRHLHGEDYQENTRRWKKLSKSQPLHTTLKDASPIASSFISGCAASALGGLCYVAGVSLSISAVILIPASIIVVTIVVLAGTIFSLMLSRIFKFDNTEYSKPHIASQTSINLVTYSLYEFNSYYGHKLNNLVRYGFINKEVGNRLKAFLRKKITLDKFINANQHLINLPPQIRNQPEIQAAIEHYNRQRDQMRELDQEYNEFRDNVMAPLLPFPSSWGFKG